MKRLNKQIFINNFKNLNDIYKININNFNFYNLKTFNKIKYNNFSDYIKSQKNTNNNTNNNNKDLKGKKNI